VAREEWQKKKQEESWNECFNEKSECQSEFSRPPGYSWLQDLTLAEQSLRIYLKAYRKGRKVSIHCNIHAIDKIEFSTKNRETSVCNQVGKACQAKLLV